jgi:hypothetical protein
VNAKVQQLSLIDWCLSMNGVLIVATAHGAVVDEIVRQVVGFPERALPP